MAVPAIPTIHLNGTSRSRLSDLLDNASEALDCAYDALKRTAPNGRDYYLQGQDVLDKATAEHMSRLRRVDEVKQEIDLILLAIDAL